MPERFAITAGTIVTMTGPPLQDAGVVVSDGVIEMIAPRMDLPQGIKIEEYPDCVLLPAFVNAHTHLVFTDFKGVADDAPFFDWLTRYIIPLEIEKKGKECLESARHGVELCFTNGITSLGESHYLPYGHQAMSEAGMKGVAFHELFGVRTLNLAKGIRTHREELERRASRSTPRLRFGVAPHAPYSVPMSMARMIRETADKLGLPLSIHVSETHDEVSLFLRGEGSLAGVRRAVRLPSPNPKRTPLKYLDECGLLGPRTLLVHGVHLSDSDLDIIAERSCTLVTCPTSNAKLGSGIARAGAWHRREIPICIATDSPASGESFDLFEEMRRFVLFQRALTGETDTFPAEGVLRMVTVNPAKALGMQDLVGSIRKGLCADFILVDPDRKHISSNRDIYGSLLWGTTSQDIVSVWSDGRAVYSR